jgi:dienelactone hydrolase
VTWTCLTAVCLLCALLAGCGSSSAPKKQQATEIPRLGFDYDASAPLRYVDRGRVNQPGFPIAIDDVSYRSGNARIDGFLLLPPGSGRRPAVVFVHGSGGDRGQLLLQAAWLAARNVVTLTITGPSTSSPPAAGAQGASLLKQARTVQVRDVVAVRRAVDVLRSLPQVDPGRIGYLGWSAGAKTGTFVAASDPRVKALVLMSAGAEPLAAFVANAPPPLRRAARGVLGSVDPIRYIARARPGSILLENGRNDEVVPQAALQNIAHAAPRGTKVRWYDATHALNKSAYHDAFDWLARKLAIRGPRVPGAVTESSAP